MTKQQEQEEKGLTYAEALLLRKQLEETRGMEALDKLMEASVQEALQFSKEDRQDYRLLLKIKATLADPEKRRAWMRDNGVPVYDEPHKPMKYDDARAREERSAAYGDETEVPESCRFRGYGGKGSSVEHFIGQRWGSQNMDGHFASGGGNPEWALKIRDQRPDIATEKTGDTALTDKINGGWGGINR